MATVEIVEAAPDDLEAVVQLFDAYRVFYRQSSDVAAARAFIRERFARRDSVIFLGRVGGEPAGFVQLYPSLSSVSMRPIWILNDLFVAPAARGAGVGRRLITIITKRSNHMPVFTTMDKMNMNVMLVLSLRDHRVVSGIARLQAISVQ